MPRDDESRQADQHRRLADGRAGRVHTKEVQFDGRAAERGAHNAARLERELQNQRQDMISLVRDVFVRAEVYTGVDGTPMVRMDQSLCTETRGTLNAKLVITLFEIRFNENRRDASITFEAIKLIPVFERLGLEREIPEKLARLVAAADSPGVKSRGGDPRTR